MTESINNSNNNIKPIIVPYRTIIKQIIHISDIHIHLYKRHNEYKEVFQLLFDELKKNKGKT